MWPVITNGFGICYMLNVCVLSRDLSPVVEIWIILSGMFRTLDKKKSIKKKKRHEPCHEPVTRCTAWY